MLAYSAACPPGTVEGLFRADAAKTSPLATSAEESATAPTVLETRIFMGPPVSRHCYHKPAPRARRHIALEFMQQERHLVPLCVRLKERP
jgi:hypothetical protein